MTKELADLQQLTQMLDPWGGGFGFPDLFGGFDDGFEDDDDDDEF